MTSISTCDLYDRYEDNPSVQVVKPVFRHFGGLQQFSGPMRTLNVLEDNTFVRKMLNEAGQGQVLVVNGAGSMRCALLGDQIAQLAVDNGWTGLIINGCVRDSLALAKMPLGVLALATNPRKSVKRDVGEPDVPLMFADCRWITGEFVYADEDGVLISPSPLRLHD